MSPSGEKRVFVAYAADDFKHREALERHRPDAPRALRYVDMPAATPGSAKWKSQARETVLGCDGVIVLVSRHTSGAASVMWQLACAKEAGKRILAVRIGSGDSAARPGLDGQPVVDWDQSEIERFLASL